MAEPPTPNPSTPVPTAASPTLTPTTPPTFSPTIQSVEFDAIATALLVASLGSLPSSPIKCACYHQLMTEFQTSFLSVLFFCFKVLFFCVLHCLFVDEKALSTGKYDGR